jgi:hypothetical protein
MKEDQTLLTEADVAVQQAICEILRNADATARIVSEEDADRNDFRQEQSFTWIVDPIDGTKEFVRANGREYCSAVAAVVRGVPVAALVIAPELGIGGRPLIFQITPSEGRALINEEPTEPAKLLAGPPKRFSITRSASMEPRPFESRLVSDGCKIKTVATSQTLDMLRVALDFSSLSEDAGLEPFDVFYRNTQHIWDGACGLAFNLACSRRAIDLSGRPLIPLSEEVVRQRYFSSAIVGLPEHVEWFRTQASRTVPP